MKRPSKKLDPKILARAKTLAATGLSSRELVAQLGREGMKVSRAALSENGVETSGGAGGDGEAQGPSAAPEVDAELAGEFRTTAKEGLLIFRLAMRKIKNELDKPDAVVDEKQVRILLDGAERAAKIAGTLDARVRATQATEGKAPGDDVLEADATLQARLAEFMDRSAPPAPDGSGSAPSA